MSMGGGLSHHLLQTSQSFIGPVMGHKQVIVVKRRDRIHAYSGFCQPRGDRCQKTDRLKRGMNGQSDQTRCKLVSETQAFGFLLPDDKRHSLAFTESKERPGRRWNFRLFRNRAKYENARLHFRFHAGQECLKIEFACHSQSKPPLFASKFTAQLSSDNRMSADGPERRLRHVRYFALSDHNRHPGTKPASYYRT